MRKLNLFILTVSLLIIGEVSAQDGAKVDSAYGVVTISSDWADLNGKTLVDFVPLVLKPTLYTVPVGSDLYFNYWHLERVGVSGLVNVNYGNLSSLVPFSELYSKLSGRYDLFLDFRLEKEIWPGWFHWGASFNSPDSEMLSTTCDTCLSRRGLETQNNVSTSFSIGIMGHGAELRPAYSLNSERSDIVSGLSPIHQEPFHYQHGLFLGVTTESVIAAGITDFNGDKMQKIRLAQFRTGLIIPVNARVRTTGSWHEPEEFKYFFYADAISEIQHSGASRIGFYMGLSFLFAEKATYDGIPEIRRARFEPSFTIYPYRLYEHRLPLIQFGLTFRSGQLKSLYTTLP